MSSFDRVSIAYSPDSDDAFMIHALKEKIIPWGEFEFSFFAYDIQVLNEKSLLSEFDISAISFAVLPQIKNFYELMPVGASVGRGYGPAIVVSEHGNVQTVADLKDKKIAVPGKWTSAFLAARYVLPPFTPVFTSFLEVENLVLQGEADAGVLIHEKQIATSEGLRKIDDLGSLWMKKTSLPLPLGGNIIREAFSEEKKKKLVDLYRDSIVWALGHKEETAKLSNQKAQAKLSDELAIDYIDRFANHDAVELKEDVIEGILKLLNITREHR